MRLLESDPDNQPGERHNVKETEEGEGRNRGNIEERKQITLHIGNGKVSKTQDQGGREVSPACAGQSQ